MCAECSCFVRVGLCVGGLAMLPSCSGAWSKGMGAQMPGTSADSVIKPSRCPQRTLQSAVEKCQVVDGGKVAARKGLRP